MITVTLYSDPLSSGAIAECSPYQGVCVLLSVFLKRDGKCGCVCVCVPCRGFVSALFKGAAAF